MGKYSLDSLYYLWTSFCKTFPGEIFWVFSAGFGGRPTALNLWHMIEQVATDPAVQALAQVGVVIGPRHDHIGAEIGGA